ncbi:MAG: TenA family protein [Deltaproteobacteria bacterium]|jgi:thiaminase/transcriptional activator TenA|nr:TenA family protein [Deltaproteobacteria bacterium]
MSWSQNAWRAIEPIFAAITQHPFIRELSLGTLDREKFLFFMNQDALYLEDFGKVLAGVAIKCQVKSDVDSLLGFASEHIKAEMVLHKLYLADQNLSAERSPSCLLYTSFLYRQLSVAAGETAFASTIPCFWIYQKVGDYLLSLPKTPHNPYQSWIDLYGGEEFAQGVRTALGIIDRFAAETTEAIRAEMLKVFILASKMEWLFWDSAYKLEKWAI